MNNKVNESQKDDAVPGLPNNYRLIGISRLDFDLDNYRIGHQTDSRQALRAIITRMPDQIIELGLDIVDKGLDPSTLMIVTPDTNYPGNYIVLEGNRRLTAIRLLENPNKADGVNQSVFNEFKKLSKLLSEPILSRLCFVVNDRSDGRPWVDLRHLGPQKGRGLLQWGNIEKGRRQKDRGGKVIPHIAVLDYMKAHGFLKNITDENLVGNATNIERVVNGSAYKKAAHVTINQDWSIHIENGHEFAAQVLTEAVYEDFVFRGKKLSDVYTSDQRKVYISELIKKLESKGSFKQNQNDEKKGSNENQPNTKNGKSENPSQHANTGNGKESEPTKKEEGDSSKPDQSDQGNQTDTKKKPKKDSLLRETLAPRDRSRTLVIKDYAVNKIYLEMRDLVVDDQPGVGSVVMRVFLESIVEMYLSDKGITPPKGKTSWSETGLSLNLKVKTILHKIDSGHTDPDLHMARQGEADDTTMHSIFNLHKFVHYTKAKANPRELKEIWDRWEPLFLKICE